jgi:hypothetical protein
VDDRDRRRRPDDYGWPGNRPGSARGHRRTGAARYGLTRDMAFMAWLESRPFEEKVEWAMKTPEVQAGAKAAWVNLAEKDIREGIRKLMTEANPPIHLTTEEISAIVQEGRSQHWPERP